MARLIVLTVGYRKHWGGNPYADYQPWQNIVVLNSKIEGGWGTEQHVEDILTTPGMDMVWRICARSTEFSIVLNHKEIATYTYRVPVATVSRVEFLDWGSDSVLQKLSVVDSPQTQHDGQLISCATRNASRYTWVYNHHQLGN